MIIKTNVPSEPALFVNVDEYRQNARLSIQKKDGETVNGYLQGIYHDYVTIRKGNDYEDYNNLTTIMVRDMESVEPAEEKKVIGQVQTERGLLYVEAEYQSKERARMDGYDFAFHSSKLGADLYSKSLDDRGLKHSFAVIRGYV